MNDKNITIQQAKLSAHFCNLCDVLCATQTVLHEHIQTGVHKYNQSKIAWKNRTQTDNLLCWDQYYLGCKYCKLKYLPVGTSYETHSQSEKHQKTFKLHLNNIKENELKVHDITNKDIAASKDPKDVEVPVHDITNKDIAASKDPMDVEVPVHDITNKDNAASKDPMDVEVPVHALTNKDIAASKDHKDVEVPIHDITNKDNAASKDPMDVEVPVHDITNKDNAASKDPMDVEVPVHDLTNKDFAASKDPMDVEVPVHDITNKDIVASKDPKDVEVPDEIENLVAGLVLSERNKISHTDVHVVGSTMEAPSMPTYSQLIAPLNGTPVLEKSHENPRKRSIEDGACDQSGKVHRAALSRLNIINSDNVKSLRHVKFANEKDYDVPKENIIQDSETHCPVDATENLDFVRMKKRLRLSGDLIKRRTSSRLKAANKFMSSFGRQHLPQRTSVLNQADVELIEVKDDKTGNVEDDQVNVVKNSISSISLRTWKNQPVERNATLSCATRPYSGKKLPVRPRLKLTKSKKGSKKLNVKPIRVKAKRRHLLRFDTPKEIEEKTVMFDLNRLTWTDENTCKDDKDIMGPKCIVSNLGFDLIKEMEEKTEIFDLKKLTWADENRCNDDMKIMRQKCMVSNLGTPQMDNVLNLNERVTSSNREGQKRNSDSLAPPNEPVLKLYKNVHNEITAAQLQTLEFTGVTNEIIKEKPFLNKHTSNEEQIYTGIQTSGEYVDSSLDHPMQLDMYCKVRASDGVDMFVPITILNKDRVEQKSFTTQRSILSLLTHLENTQEPLENAPNVSGPLNTGVTPGAFTDSSIVVAKYKISSRMPLQYENGTNIFGEKDSSKIPSLNVQYDPVSEDCSALYPSSHASYGTVLEENSEPSLYVPYDPVSEGCSTLYPGPYIPYDPVSEECSTVYPSSHESFSAMLEDHSEPSLNAPYDPVFEECSTIYPGPYVPNDPVTEEHPTVYPSLHDSFAALLEDHSEPSLNVPYDPVFEESSTVYISSYKPYDPVTEEHPTVYPSLHESFAALLEDHSEPSLNAPYDPVFEKSSTGYHSSYMPYDPVAEEHSTVYPSSYLSYGPDLEEEVYYTGNSSSYKAKSPRSKLFEEYSQLNPKCNFLVSRRLKCLTSKFEVASGKPPGSYSS